MAFLSLRTRLRKEILYIHMSCIHDLAINKENHDTTSCCGGPETTHSFTRRRLTRVYADSGLPESKMTYRISPGPDLPTDATPRARSVLGGPSPRRGNASGFRRNFEAQGFGAYVARRTRTAVPRPRITPLTNTRSFVSRRHKSRGDPRSRTGLRCGQAIVREGAHRPVIKVYIYKGASRRAALAARRFARRLHAMSSAVVVFAS